MSSPGLVSRVALYPGMLTCGVCLPFCRLVREILHYLGLATVQLIPNGWRLLMSSCIIARKALSLAREVYPDQMAQEFLSVYRINRHPGSLCGFQARVPGWRIAALESRYSSFKDHTKRFFFVSGSGWEFPEKEKAQGEFPIQVNCGRLPFMQSIEIRLTPEEEAQVEKVIKWAQRHKYESNTDIALSYILEFYRSPSGSPHTIRGYSLGGKRGQLNLPNMRLGYRKLAMTLFLGLQVGPVCHNP